MFNQSKAFAIGLLVAVFLVGIGVGSAGSHWLRSQRTPPRRDPRMTYADRLARDVGLSPTQRDSVAAIVGRYTPRMRVLFESVQPQTDSLRRQMRADIRLHLTTEQRAVYDSLIARDRARAARRDSAAQRTERNDDDD